MPSTASTTPPHVRARQRIIALIDRLTAQGVDRLPPERQLSEELGVSLNTIKKAIRQLATEDRLVTAPRDGHFIRAKRGGTVDIGIILGEAGVSTFIRDPAVLACILTTLHRLGCLGRVLHVREPADAARICEQYRIDGCLWFMPRAALCRSIAAVIRSSPLPIAVTLLEQPPEGVDLAANLFTFDHAAIGRARAEFLLARGHRRIVLLGDDRSASFSGFAAALAEQGVPVDRALVIAAPDEIPRRLPPLLQDAGATAIISDGGPERLEILFGILDGHPWGGRGDLLVDHIGPWHEELRRRHPLVRITAVNYGQEVEIGLRAAEALVAAIRQRVPIQGMGCRSRILPVEAVPG